MGLPNGTFVIEKGRGRFPSTPDLRLASPWALEATEADAGIGCLSKKNWPRPASPFMLKVMNSAVNQLMLTSVLELVWILTSAVGLRAAEPVSAAKPVFLYSRYFNAEGETRYLPEGTYQDVLRRLQAQFEVRANREALTDASLSSNNEPSPIAASTSYESPTT
jgi:hypothetical protein